MGSIVCWKRRKYGECIGKPSAIAVDTKTQLPRRLDGTGGLHIKNSKTPVYFECKFSSPGPHVHVNGTIGSGGIQIIKDFPVLHGGYDLMVTDAMA